MKLLLYFSLLVFSTSCATMNTSILETTKPMGKGNGKLGFEYGEGIDLSSTAFFTNEEDITLEDKKLLAIPYFGIVFGKGLTDNLDLNGKFWLGVGGFGARLFGKYRLYGDGDKFGIAILPGLNYVSSAGELNIFGLNSDNNPNITVLGAELPILIDFNVNNVITLYAAARYSFDNVSFTYSKISDYVDTDFTLNRYGFLTGLSLDGSWIYLRGEIGVEGAKPLNEDFNYAPIYSVGLGFKF